MPDIPKPPDSVIVGHANQKSSEIQEIPVESFTSHPDYSLDETTGISRKNDIALLKLSRPIKFDDTVVPICLPSEDTDIQDELILTGWGFNDDSLAKKPDVLQELNLTYVPLEDCSKDFAQALNKPNLELRNTIVCGAGKLNKSDGCGGDSGGPLIQQIENTYDDGSEIPQFETIGVVSGGDGKCISRIPGLYTRVSEYIPWIEDFVYKNRP